MNVSPTAPIDITIVPVRDLTRIAHGPLSSPAPTDSVFSATTPAMQRDLSIAVAADFALERLAERINAALLSRAELIQEILVLSTSRHADLSGPARRRLGIAPGQINIVLRVVIRDLERTATADEANELRDIIYEALHEGAVRTWTARETQL